MKILRITLGIVTGLFFLLLLISWLSVTVPGVPARSRAVVIHGLVAQIAEDRDTKDIIIKLKNGVTRSYYINRGMETISSPTALYQLRGKQVKLYVYKGWDLLGLFRPSHICELQHESRVVYSEYDKD